MATSPNFNWPEPDNTDLVKNGALAIRTAVNAIDASLYELKGGTTGQVLSKTSNTDMDFTWVAQDDSNAIQNAIVDAKGDLIAATAADTPARLAVGTNGQILTADSTAATGLVWATAGTGGMTLISTTSLSGSSTTISSIPSTYKNLQLVIRSAESNATANIMSFTANSITNYDYITQYGNNSGASVFNSSGFSTTSVKLTGTNLRNSNSGSKFVIDMYDYNNATSNKTGDISASYLIGTNYGEINTGGFTIGATAAITSITIAIAGGSTFSAGSALLYGVN